MPNDFSHRAPLDDQQDGDLLDDLELRCRTDVSTARNIATWRCKSAVVVRPANVTDREAIATGAQTTEVRRQGVVCLASRPTMVGSFYHLTFDRKELDLPPTLAVCDRSSMLCDVSFELSFKFLQEINLPQSAPGNRGD